MGNNIGVVITEQDANTAPAIVPADTTNFGFLIESGRGVPDKAKRVTSYAQVTKAFGDPRATSANNEYGVLALKGAFENAKPFGMEAYVVRVTGASTVAANQPLKCGSFVLEAISVGLTKNDLMAKVEAATSGTSGYKKITIREAAGTEEVFDEVHIDNVASAINTGVSGINSGNASNLARVRSVGAAMPANLAYLAFSNGTASLKATAEFPATFAANATITGAHAATLATITHASPTGTVPDAGVARVIVADQSQTTDDASAKCGESDATGKFRKIAQSFKLVGSKLATVVLDKNTDTGTFAGTVTISVVTADATTSDPDTDNPIAQWTYTNAEWLALSAGDITLSFDAQLSASVTYWLLIETSTADDSNLINFGSNAAGGYANGTLKRWNTTDGWVDTSDDLEFTMNVYEYIRYPSKTSTTLTNSRRGSLSSNPIAFAGSEVIVWYASPSNLKAASLGSDDPGVWGNNLAIEITQTTGEPTKRDLNVYEYVDGLAVLRESWSSLTTTNYHSKINDPTNGSDYIRFATNGVIPDAQTNVDKFAQGADGSATTDNDYIGVQASKTGKFAFDDVDVSVITAIDSTSATVLSSLESYASSEGDILAIGTASYAATLATLESSYSSTLFKSQSYLAMYRGWLQVNDPVSGSAVWIPPMGHILGAYYVRRMMSQSKLPHTPPAGLDISMREILSTEFPNYNNSDLEYLVHSVGFNPVQFISGRGIIARTSRTMSTDSSKYSIAIRRSLNYIKESLFTNFSFVEQTTNDENIRARVVDALNFFFSSLYNAQPYGMFFTEGGYANNVEVKCDEENNPATVARDRKLVVDIKLNFVETVETVEINLQQATLPFSVTVSES